MSELIVLAFNTETGAQEMLDAVGQLQKQRLITLTDAAIVVRDRDGDVGVWQANSLIGHGTLGRGFWHGLIHRAFPMSSAGLAAGAMGDASADGLSDVSVGDFITKLGETIQPGNSALLLVVTDLPSDEAMEELKKCSAKVLRTSLSSEDEDAPFEGEDAPFESLSGDEDFNGW